MNAMITTGYGSPEVFQFSKVAKPIAKANEILVRIQASSVTTADTMMRTGKPYIGRLFTGLLKPKLEIWGTGFAGVVESVGTEVKTFKPGDKVFGESLESFGTYAEYIALPENGMVDFMPESLSFEEAAVMCDGGITSLNFLVNVGNIKTGQRVLINGASGSLGTAAVQIAKYFGAHVTGVCSAKNIPLVKQLGADEVIDYTKQDFASNTNSYDFIYDTVGARSFSECQTALKANGIYASPVLGGPLLFDMLLTSISGNKKAKFSATGALPKAEHKRLLELLLSIVEAEKFKGVIDRTYALDQLGDAHQYIGKGHKIGNVVLRPVA